MRTRLACLCAILACSRRVIARKDRSSAWTNGPRNYGTVAGLFGQPFEGGKETGKSRMDLEREERMAKADAKREQAGKLSLSRKDYEQKYMPVLREMEAEAAPREQAQESQDLSKASELSDDSAQSDAEVVDISQSRVANQLVSKGKAVAAAGLLYVIGAQTYAFLRTRPWNRNRQLNSDSDAEFDGTESNSTAQNDAADDTDSVNARLHQANKDATAYDPAAVLPGVMKGTPSSARDHNQEDDVDDDTSSDEGEIVFSSVAEAQQEEAQGREREERELADMKKQAQQAAEGLDDVDDFDDDADDKGYHTPPEDLSNV